MTRRTLSVLVTCACGLLATPLMLAMALMADPPSAEPPTPLHTVQKLDTLMQAREYDAANQLVDFRAKGRGLVPDLWEAAPENERTDMVLFLEDMFLASWRAWRTGEGILAGDFVFSETRTSANTAVVDQLRLVDGARRLSGFRYYLSLESQRWIVVDRTSVVHGNQRAVEGRVKVIRSRIAADLGPQPTLREFVVNAPSWLSRVKARTFRAGDLIGD